MKIITFFYNLLWGDLIIVPLPGGSTLGLALLVLILIPAGIYFTVDERPAFPSFSGNDPHYP